MSRQSIPFHSKVFIVLVGVVSGTTALGPVMYSCELLALYWNDSLRRPPLHFRTPLPSLYASHQQVLSFQYGSMLAVAVTSLSPSFSSYSQVVADS